MAFLRRRDNFPLCQTKRAKHCRPLSVSHKSNPPQPNLSLLRFSLTYISLPPTDALRFEPFSFLVFFSNPVGNEASYTTLLHSRQSTAASCNDGRVSARLWEKGGRIYLSRISYLFLSQSKRSGGRNKGSEEETEDEGGKTMSRWEAETEDNKGGGGKEGGGGVETSRERNSVSGRTFSRINHQE